MNIFVLENCPIRSAKSACDKHVIKMILESAQMLCSVFEPGSAPYRRGYYNHPCTKWSRETRQNYEWLLKHGKALSSEYTYRYGKRHKSEDVIDWCASRYKKLNLPTTGLTNFAQAMPEKYRDKCSVKAYRQYYNGEKAYFAKWSKRPIPRWFGGKSNASL